MSIYSDAVLADAPVSYWRLGEPSGTNAADVKGLNAGTYVNAPTLAQAGPILNDTDTAVLFNGTDEYVTVANSASLNITGSLTLEAWAKPTGTGLGEKSLIMKSYTSHNPPYYQYGLTLYGPTNAITFYVSIAGVWQFTQAASSGYLEDVWQHFVGVYNGVTMKNYLNSVEKSSANVTGTLDTYATPLLVAAYENLAKTDIYCLGGPIDEVAVYSTALAPARIEDHYLTGKYGRAGVRASYRTFPKRKLRAAA